MGVGGGRLGNGGEAKEGKGRDSIHTIIPRPAASYPNILLGRQCGNMLNPPRWTGNEGKGEKKRVLMNVCSRSRSLGPAAH